MKKNKKIIAACGVSLAATVALVAGTFAFFTDSAEKSTGGTAGKVSIEMTDPALSNSGNINPGDGDETVNSERPGTTHDLTFTVTNTGNKSIMTRNVITLSVKQGEKFLNAAYYSLKVDDTNELVEKYYSVDGETFTKTKPETGDVKYVRYVTTQVALNGVGANNEVEASYSGVTSDAVTTKAVDSVPHAAVEYDYILKLDKNTPDGEFELSNLIIDVEVQAMQYRNTTDAEWETLFSDTLTIN